MGGYAKGLWVQPCCPLTKATRLCRQFFHTSPSRLFAPGQVMIGALSKTLRRFGILPAFLVIFWGVLGWASSCLANPANTSNPAVNPANPPRAVNIAAPAKAASPQSVPASLANPVPAASSISYGYGWRRDPITGQPDFHNGIDFIAPMGSVVQAWAGGVVQQVPVDNACGLGVVIASGAWRQVYCHLASVQVRPRQTVVAGHPLGTVGSTGHSNGPHLHWTLLWNGRLVNPQLVLQKMRLTLPLQQQPPQNVVARDAITPTIRQADKGF